jgi:hypothetical protein
LEQFTNGITAGVPKEGQKVDEYLTKMAKHNSNLIQWLEDFKNKYGDAPEAQQPIKDTEGALKNYKSKIGAAMAKVHIAKAIEARKADGSPLVYFTFLSH